MRIKNLIRNAPRFSPGRSADPQALPSRRRNAVKQLARLPPDPLALAPHESRPPLTAPQMPPVLPRIAPAAAPAQFSARPRVGGWILYDPHERVEVRPLSTSASPSSSRRGRIVRARLCSVQTGLAQTMSKCPGGNSVQPQLRCRTGSWAQISTRCPGRRPPTLPPRRLGQSTLCHKTAPAVSACLTITTSATKHAQARARLKQFRMLGPIFF